MILVCRDCHATVPFGCDCPCGGVVELGRTQIDELLLRAWKYQRLETMYREFGPDFVPEEAFQVSADVAGTFAENAASGAAICAGCPATEGSI
jgi:hypothetical protein